MDLPDLDAVRTFLTLAERGSILGTANALRTSRARVRRQLEQLEEALGVALTARVRDGVELTEAGQQFLPPARKLVGEARHLLSQMRAREDSTMGEFRVGLQVGYPHALAVMAGNMVSAVLPDVRSHHVVCERPADLLPDKADFVIGIGDQRPTAPCVEVELTRIHQGLFASRPYLDTHGEPTSLSDVLPRMLGVWRDPDGDFARLHLRDGGTREVEAQYVTPDEGFLASLAAQGEGYIYAPVVAGAHATGAPLVRVLEAEVGRRVAARLYVPEALAEEPRMSLVLQTFRRVAATMGA